MGTILSVKDLAVSFYGELGETKAVKNASFDIEEGQFYGIVGESGSGKSVATKSILQLLPSNGKILEGSIEFQGTDLLRINGEELRAIRGNEIAIVFQDSLSALNPVYTIGNKMIELILRHSSMTKQQARDRAIELLNEVGLPDAAYYLKCYPHELSGGMRQRVMIAMAMSCNPKVLIADEPTTALDVTIQAQILNLLRKLQKKSNMSIVIITHDLGVVAQTCSRISVMCGGYVVEEGSVEEIFYTPKHPYTQALIASMPKVGEEEFEVFLEREVAEDGGSLCPFLSRCRYAVKECEEYLPDIQEVGIKHVCRCHRRGEHQ